MMAPTSAKTTKRRELEPSRGLPSTLHSRFQHRISLWLAHIKWSIGVGDIAVKRGKVNDRAVD